MAAPRGTMTKKAAGGKRAGARPVSCAGKPEHETFDAHRWLERYLTSHEAAEFPDELRGVPFN